MIFRKSDIIQTYKNKKGVSIVKKLKIKLQKVINNIKTLNNKEKKTIFLVTIITSMIVHFQLYALIITGPDTLINSIYHQADIWEPMLLRFGLDFMQMIKGNIVSPMLVTLISSIILGLTVILTIDLLEIKNKYFKYITAIIFVVAPNISATLTFFYCSDAYILGMFLATLSVYIVRKYKDTKWTILISGILIALALGMYQTYLSVTMVLCIATLIVDVLNDKDKKEIGINIIKYILMGIVGIVIFYIIAYLTLAFKGLPASNYSGANSIGMETLFELPKLLPEAYQSFFSYYFNDKIIPNTIWNTNLFYIAIFATVFVSIIYIIIKNKLHKRILNIMLLLLFIIIAPICFGIIEITVPDVDIHILMACSMIYIFPIFLRILEILPRNTIEKVLKSVVIFCSLIIIWNYIWQDNASYIAINTMQKQTESLALRLVSQIEQLDGYNQDMPVLILGDLKKNSYLDKNNTSIEAKKIYNRTWGFISDYSTIWSENLDSWRKILYEYVGVNINLVSINDNKEILDEDEFKNMNFYPQNDSIKIINNMVVIKLNK
jgi:hypothetical protein